MRQEISKDAEIVFRVHYGQGYADCPTLNGARHLADLLENQGIGPIWVELIVDE